MLVLAAAALGVSACKPAPQQADAQNAPPPLAALPLTTDAGAPSAPAPLVNQLPPAPPIRVARTSSPGDRYAYMDRAYYVNQAFADAPPDYAFEDNQVSPWVWRSDDGYTRVVEPLPSGDRYYYYEPGSDRPFLVRDPDYAYGYSNGDLVTVYDSRGQALSDYDVENRSDYAARYFARAALLFALSQHDHHAVARDHWESRRGRIYSDYTSWSDQQAAQPDWRAYHDQHVQDEQAHWAPEMYRRNAEGARFAQQTNDQTAAQRDWQNARQAAQVAQTNHVPIPGGSRGGNSGQGGPGGPSGGPPPVIAPAPGPGAAAHQQAEAARQARLQALSQHDAEAKAARDARLQALSQHDAEAKAARDARLQALAQHDAETKAARDARLQALTQHDAQAQAAKQANQQAQAKRQSDMLAAKTAREQQAAQSQAARQADQQALAKRQSDMQAAKAARDQQASQAQAARQAHQDDLAKRQSDMQAAKAARDQQAAQAQAARQAHQDDLAKRQADAQAAKAAREQQASQGQAGRQAHQDELAKRQADMQAAKAAREQQASDAQAARDARLKALADRQAQVQAAHAAAAAKADKDKKPPN